MVGFSFESFIRGASGRVLISVGFGQRCACCGYAANRCLFEPIGFLWNWLCFLEGRENRLGSPVDEGGGRAGSVFLA